MEEKAQYIIEPTRNMSEEVAAIFSLIRDYREKITRSDLKKSNIGSLETATIIISGLTLIVIIIIWVAIWLLPESKWGGSDEEVRLVLQVVTLFLYILGFLTFLFQSISMRRFLSGMHKELMEAAESGVLYEFELFASLDPLSTQSIEYVAKKLDHLANHIGDVRSFLLGAIEKVGIIPGLIATVIAIGQIAQDSDRHWIELLSFGLLGVYLLMFPLASSAFKLRNIAFVLNQYLTQFRSEGREHND